MSTGSTGKRANSHTSLTRCSACTCNTASVTLETSLGARRFCADVAAELVKMGRGRVV